MHALLELLQSLPDPLTGQPFHFALPPVLNDKGELLELGLTMGYPLGYAEPLLRASLEANLAPLLKGRSLRVHLETKVNAHAVQSGIKPVPRIKNIIAVASGKGGVGKSTVCANLALALARSGASVGVLDADIYGPSQPTILGVQGQAEVNEHKQFLPKRAHGIQMISIGLLVAPNLPMVWRGPMASGALQQLLYDTLWEELDYLLIDLPPGTGDIQLTLAQKVPVSGAVVVTTPQEVAVLDVVKAIEMLSKVNIPVLGIIENMSTYECRHCGSQEAIFGEGGGERLAERYSCPFLGKLPLATTIRAGADQGCISLVAEPDGPVAQLYSSIAAKMAAYLSARPKNLSHAFSNIVTQS